MGLRCQTPPHSLQFWGLPTAGFTCSVASLSLFPCLQVLIVFTVCPPPRRPAGMEAVASPRALHSYGGAPALAFHGCGSKAAPNIGRTPNLWEDSREHLQGHPGMRPQGVTKGPLTRLTGSSRNRPKLFSDCFFHFFWCGGVGFDCFFADSYRF